MKLDQHLSAISGTILIGFFCIITVFMRYISQQNPFVKSGFALVLFFFAWILIYQFYKHLPWPYDLMIAVVLGSGITSLILFFKSHIFHQIPFLESEARKSPVPRKMARYNQGYLCDNPSRIVDLNDCYKCRFTHDEPISHFLILRLFSLVL